MIKAVSRWTLWENPIESNIELKIIFRLSFSTSTWILKSPTIITLSVLSTVIKTLRIQIYDNQQNSSCHHLTSSHFLPHSYLFSFFSSCQLASHSLSLKGLLIHQQGCTDKPLLCLWVDGQVPVSSNMCLSACDNDTGTRGWRLS